MPAYSGPHRVPVGTDPNNVPGDLVAALESVIPAMTTAQIDALDWSRKPAGRFVAYDTTKGRLVVSTGAAMVNLIDARGGTITGTTVVNAASGATDIHLASGGVNRWTLRRWTNGDFHVQRRDSAGSDQGAALIVDAGTGRVWAGRETQGGDAAATLATKGYVDAADAALQTSLDGKAASSHTHAIANVTGLQTALDGKAASSRFAAGEVSVSDYYDLTLPAVPSGYTAWTVTATPQTPSTVVAVTRTSAAVFRIWVDGPEPSTTVMWQAIAY